MSIFLKIISLSIFNFFNRQLFLLISLATPINVYFFFNKNSERYAPSCPLIPVISAIFFIK